MVLRQRHILIVRTGTGIEVDRLLLEARGDLDAAALIDVIRQGELVQSVDHLVVLVLGLRNAVAGKGEFCRRRGTVAARIGDGDLLYRIAGVCLHSDLRLISRLDLLVVKRHCAIGDRSGSFKRMEIVLKGGRYGDQRSGGDRRGVEHPLSVAVFLQLHGTHCAAQILPACLQLAVQKIGRLCSGFEDIAADAAIRIGGRLFIIDLADLNEGLVGALPLLETVIADLDGVGDDRRDPARAALGHSLAVFGKSYADLGNRAFVQA